MNLKTARVFLVLCIVLFLGVAFWLGLRNLSFFNIKQIDIKYSGPVSELSSDMQRCIMPYRGVNLFKADLEYLKSALMQFEGVESVETSMYFPGKLIIEVHFSAYQARMFSDSQGIRSFFLADSDGLKEVKEETYREFSLLCEVEISSKYSDYLVRWGADNGFAQMCVLAEGMGHKSLITSVKYDNNNSNDFGLLEIDMPSVKSCLFVREPVTSERLSDAIDMIARENAAATVSSRFDLYSNALIKRK